MRRWLILALVAIVPVTLTACSSRPATISPGPGTATITWKPVSDGGLSFGSPPQPFTGVIDGFPVSGVATTPAASSASSLGQSLKLGKIPSTFELFQWKGIFVGKPFKLGLYVTYPASTSSAGSLLLSSLKVTGTWGGQAVNGHVVSPTASDGNAPLHFVGTVGPYEVSGSVPQPLDTGGRTKRTATATFTITG